MKALRFGNKLTRKLSLSITLFHACLSWAFSWWTYFVTVDCRWKMSKPVFSFIYLITRMHLIDSACCLKCISVYFKEAFIVLKFLLLALPTALLITAISFDLMALLQLLTDLKNWSSTASVWVSWHSWHPIFDGASWLMCIRWNYQSLFSLKDLTSIVETTLNA